jgi:hypothetical protein
VTEYKTHQISGHIKRRKKTGKRVIPSGVASKEATKISRLFKELYRQPFHCFPERPGKLVAPDTQGVYIIINSKNIVVHVGRTLRGKNGLLQRLKNHLHGSSSFTSAYFNGEGNKLRDGYKYSFLPVPKARERALLECYAIANLCPIHLGLGDEK